MSSGPVEGRVLVVDDSEVLLDLVGSSLRAVGWEIEVSRTGAEAVQVARRWSPDAAVVDLRMPEMDGFDLLRELKSVDPDLPVIFLTAEDDLSAVLRAVHEGAFDYVIKASQDIRPLLAAVDRAVGHARIVRDNARLADDLRRVNEQLATRIRELAEANHRLRHMAITDELTDVFSRRYLIETMRQCMEQAARRADAPVALLMIDIDHFKQVNDRLGHLRGDAILRAVAQRLRECVRVSDVVARFGGEEFAVLLPGTSWDAARGVAEKVRRAVEEAVQVGASITVSVGVAALEHIDKELIMRERSDGLIEQILHAADAALYQAKERGRNRVCSAAESDLQPPAAKA